MGMTKHQIIYLWHHFTECKEKKTVSKKVKCDSLGGVQHPLT